jgi:hypothetical protein
MEVVAPPMDRLEVAYSRQRISSSGFGSFASNSSLNSASMWKNAMRATLSERFGSCFR